MNTINKIRQHLNQPVSNLFTFFFQAAMGCFWIAIISCMFMLFSFITSFDYMCRISSEIFILSLLVAFVLLILSKASQ